MLDDSTSMTFWKSKTIKAGSRLVAAWEWGWGGTIKGDFGDDRMVLCLNSGDRDMAAYPVRTHGTVHLTKVNFSICKLDR